MTTSKMAANPKIALRNEEILDYLDEFEDDYEESDDGNEACIDGEASESGSKSESDNLFS